ncbi:MAG: protein kinase [Planctomycetia bacterium]|nr:protein kinase [Planctomycetia bacterium]
MLQSTDSAINLVAQLRQLKLLPTNILDDLTRRLQAGSLDGDARNLAGHLVRQNWLTPYQINVLFSGRGAELIIGPYVVLERLGEGGAGQVFKARHLRMQRIVALKIIRKELLGDPDTVARFQREIEVVSQLDHVNVVHAYDAGPAGSIFFLAMEYIEGIDLARLLKQAGPLPTAQACDYIRQAALGLQHAHERGLVHRDIKPPNFLVSPIPGQKKSTPTKGPDSSSNGALAPWGVVKLLDLGLARLQRKVDDRTNFLTAAGPQMMGTPDFMAPEQALDFHDVDIRSDIYSLGCTCYFLLTGEPPFPGGTLAQKLMKHQQAEPAPLHQQRKDVPPALNAVVQRMMAKQPADRYQSPAEVYQALASFGKGGNRPVTLSKSANGTTAFRPRPATAAAINLPALNGNTMVRGRPGDTVWKKLRPPVALWLWRRKLLVCASAASLFVLSLFMLTAAWWVLAGSSAATDIQASQARRHLDKLRAELAGSDTATQRQKLLEFRRANPGTPAALEATQWLMQLPSPLDGLDDSAIPPEKRLPWQPKELVAVLGEPNTGLRMNTIAVQPKGPLLASRGNDNSIQVWQPITGKIHATIKPTGNFFMGAALAPDGQTLAISNPDRSISVWDLSNSQERTTAQAKPLQVNHLAYAPNGRTLATSGSDTTIKLWDVSATPIKELVTLGTPGGSQNTCMTFAADGQTLATVGTDRTIRLWDVATGKEKLAFSTGVASTVALTFAPHGKTLASLGSTDGKVRLWDTATGKELASIAKATFGLQWFRFGVAETNASMLFSPDGQLLALGGLDKTNPNNNRPTILLWDVANNREVAMFQRPPDPNGAFFFLLEFDPQLQSLTTWGMDQTMRLWDIPAARERAVIKGYTGRMSALALSPSGDTLATASSDGAAKIWDAGTAKVRGQLHGHTLAITALAYGPDGQTLATASYDRSVKLWNVAARTEQTSIPVAKSFPTALAYAPDGKTLAIGTSERRVIFWDVAGNKERSVLQDSGSGWIASLAYSADGTMLAVVGEEGRFQVWKLGETPKRIELPGTGGRGESLAFSPASGRAALGSAGKVSLFVGQTRGDTTTWMRERTVDQRNGATRAVLFSPDGGRFAAAGDDSELTLWSGDGSTRLQQWRFSVPIQAASFAADGRHLATLNGDGTVYILRLAAAPTPAK